MVVFHIQLKNAHRKCKYLKHLVEIQEESINGDRIANKYDRRIYWLNNQNVYLFADTFCRQWHIWVLPTSDWIRWFQTRNPQWSQRDTVNVCWWKWERNNGMYTWKIKQWYTYIENNADMNEYSKSCQHEIRIYDSFRNVMVTTCKEVASILMNTRKRC